MRREHRGVGRLRLGPRAPLGRRVAGPRVEVGFAAGADRLGHRAARRVHAALERLAQRRQRAGDGLQRGVGLVHAELGHAAQQAHGVGVARVGEDVARRAFFDQAPGVEHADALAEARHQAQVVGDQQDGGVNAAAQLLDQVEDLGLDGGVEPGGGLVEDQQMGVHGQRHGDDHALLLAARELERVAAHGGVGVGQRHFAQALPGADQALLSWAGPRGSGRPRRPGRRRAWRGSAPWPGLGRPWRRPRRATCAAPRR